MIIRNWETFRRSFGFFAGLTISPGTLSYNNNDPSNDTIVMTAGGGWPSTGFVLPSGAAVGVATAWVHVLETLPLVQAAIQDDGGAFTDFTTEAQSAAADDVDLLPAAPLVDDAFYFGSDRVFEDITVQLTTLGAGTWTIVYEYWDGDSWESLDFIYAPTKAALFDDSAATYTDETEDASSAITADVTLLPASGNVEVNDAFYVGSSTKFGAVQFVITTNAAAETWVITWEYWNGTAWTALGGVTDGTSSFKTQGTNRLTYTIPSDWETKEIDSSIPGTLYYVRGRVTTGSAPAVRPVGTTVSPIVLVVDSTVGFTVGTTKSVNFVTPDDWATTTVNSQGPFYYARARVSAFTSITTQPLAGQVWNARANDGVYPVSAIVGTKLTIDNTNTDIERLIQETTVATVADFNLRHIDDADGVDNWQIAKVRETGSGFGDAGSTMSGVTLPVSAASGSTLTANASAQDGTPYADEYDWFVSQQTADIDARFLTVSDVLEADGITPRSGSIAMVASTNAVSELSIDTAVGFTSAQLTDVYRDCFAYVQRLSGEEIQAVNLLRAATSGEQ